MKYNLFFGPIALRYIFFAINFFITVRTTSIYGWNFFSVLLAIFATRDLVHAIRLTDAYFKLREQNQSKHN